jgi:hypothetical protein
MALSKTYTFGFIVFDYTPPTLPSETCHFLPSPSVDTYVKHHSMKKGTL